jgi:hypothetical protein
MQSLPTRTLFGAEEAFKRRSIQASSCLEFTCFKDNHERWILLYPAGQAQAFMFRCQEGD